MRKVEKREKFAQLMAELKERDLTLSALSAYCTLSYGELKLIESYMASHPNYVPYAQTLLKMLRGLEGLRAAHGD